jgi:hypothetical protein
MQTPHRPSHTTRSSQHGHITTPPANTDPTDWRCTRCAKLLGICRDGHMHLRFARGHEYLVSLPATATCRGCGTLNRAIAPTR